MSSFPKYKDISFLSSVAVIDEELFLLQKFLFELKIEHPQNTQKIYEHKTVGSLSLDFQKKPHYFLFIKRRIAQLTYRKSILLKQQSKN